MKVSQLANVAPLGVIDIFGRSCLSCEVLSCLGAELLHHNTMGIHYQLNSYSKCSSLSFNHLRWGHNGAVPEISVPFLYCFVSFAVYQVQSTRYFIHLFVFLLL